MLCLIQATSPFLQPDFLESGYKLVLQGYDSVFSATRCKKLRWTEMTSRWVPLHLPILPRGTTPINFSASARPR